METSQVAGQPSGEPGTADRPIVTRVERLWLDGDGIFRAVSLPGAEYTREDAERGVASLWELGGRRCRPVLVDMRRAKSMDRGARSYYAGPETARVQCAAALIIESPLTRVIGNFFLGLNKPLLPTRLFTSEPEAMAWLRTFVA
jgi:hypothetical protein